MTIISCQISWLLTIVISTLVILAYKNKYLTICSIYHVEMAKGLNSIGEENLSSHLLDFVAGAYELPLQQSD